MSSAPSLVVADEATDEIQTIPGTPFGGGFFLGRIAIEGQSFALIVAPKAEGEHESIVWKSDWRTATAGTRSFVDGFANTEAMVAAGGHPVAEWARGLRIAGFDDWYLPARDELELAYRYLKPTDDAHYGYGNQGYNDASIPPGGYYTTSSPMQTEVEAFREGGPEAFERRYYWSSTEFDPALAWFQDFGVGNQFGGAKGGVLRARAVRKVLI